MKFVKKLISNISVGFVNLYYNFMLMVLNGNLLFCNKLAKHLIGTRQLSLADPIEQAFEKSHSRFNEDHILLIKKRSEEFSNIHKPDRQHPFTRLTLERELEFAEERRNKLLEDIANKKIVEETRNQRLFKVESKDVV